MGFLTKVFGSTVAKTIMLQGIAVPVIGTVVGFEVQKALIKREQKKALKAQQEQAAKGQIDGEVIDVDSNGLRP